MDYYSSVGILILNLSKRAYLKVFMTSSCEIWISGDDSEIYLSSSVTLSLVLSLLDLSKNLLARASLKRLMIASCDSLTNFSSLFYASDGVDYSS